MSCMTCNTNCVEAGTRDDKMCSAWTKRDDVVVTDKNVVSKTNAEMFQDVFGRFPYLPCEDGYYIDAKLQDRQWWDMPFRRDIYACLSKSSLLMRRMEDERND